MRRNDSVLVYAVTGLLIVILGIAVIFGEESALASKTGDGARVGDGKEGAGTGLLETPGLDLIPVKPKVEPDPANHPADSPPVDPTDPTKAGGVEPPPVEPVVKIDPKPLGKDVDKEGSTVAPVPLVTRTIAEQVTRVLGASERQGDYRTVTARSDDRLSTLVQRWCGSLEALPMVEALNEDLKQGKAIPGGRKVLVPWTDDEILLAAHKERKTKLVQIERKKGEVYTLKKGDSLWRIAVGRVGSRQAPAYIKAIVQSNPELEDPDAVREGQKIRLPSPQKPAPPKSQG